MYFKNVKHIRYRKYIFHCWLKADDLYIYAILEGWYFLKDEFDFFLSMKLQVFVFLKCMSYRVQS